MAYPGALFLVFWGPLESESVHDHRVREWFRRGRPEASADVVRRFEEGFARVWRRAASTLGEITLSAITRRVLHDAMARRSDLSPLEVGPAGLDPDSLAALRQRAEAGELDPESLEETLRGVLVELLTVVGRLTAEILTPALHEALDAPMSEIDPEPSSARTSDTAGSAPPDPPKDTAS